MVFVRNVAFVPCSVLPAALATTAVHVHVRTVRRYGSTVCIPIPVLVQLYRTAVRGTAVVPS
jgi:hypothetical protein